MLKRLKRKLLNYCLKNLFNAVTEDEVFSEDKASGSLLIGKIPASDTRLRNFKAEAQAMRRGDLYPQLIKDLQYIANKKIFITSNSIDDIIFGKAMLFCIDVLDKKVKKISLLNLNDGGKTIQSRNYFGR